MLISIIIPAYNEENTIIDILKKVNLERENFNLQIIVSDDKSSDKTRDLLIKNKSLYDKLILNDKNNGKGSAIINALKETTGDYVLIQDADLEYDPTDYKKMISPVVKDNADVVYGSRFQGSDPKRILYFTHRFANFIITILVNILTNINFSDVETGYKLVKTSILKDLNLKERTFAFEIETTMKLSKRKLKFYEVGINYFGRTYEEGKKIGFKDGIIALYKIFYYRFFN